MAAIGSERWGNQAAFSEFDWGWRFYSCGCQYRDNPNRTTTVSGECWMCRTEAPTPAAPANRSGDDE